MQQFPKISVVTVTYNAEKYIKKTLLSILEQNYSNLELVVVDGLSSDKTIEIIKNETKNNIITFVSERDKGVYDAMSKGVKLATGDWIIFMNAGDFFFSKDSVSKVFENSFQDNISVVYGNAEFRLKSIAYVEKPSANVSTNQYMPFSHQAAFVRTTVFYQINFNLDFKIAADAAFFLELVINDYCFKYIDVTVCSYNALEGLSADNDYKRSIEIVEIQALLNKIDPKREYFVQYIKDAQRRSRIRKLLPNFLWIWLRENQTTKNHSTYRI